MTWKSLKTVLAGLVVVALAACSPTPPSGREDTVTVFAAASLTDALTEIAADYERSGSSRVRLSFAGSGAVARQIEAGAPADVVILADPVWMDRLTASGRLGKRRLDLLVNTLVVIAPNGTAVGGDPFAALAAGGRVAIGDPQSVPAGAYARTWLQATGRWDTVKDRLVFAADVRGVRAFVARQEAALGVVYRSDAVGRNDVRIVLEPPPSEQPAILYPAAETADGGAEGRAFLDHLSTPRAAAIFRRHGFEPVA